jgi:hypothetical protein
MVVNNLYVERIALLPSETNSPLVVDTDTPLTFAISVQLFELVAWRDSEVLQPLGCIQDLEFELHPTLDVDWESSGPFATENLLGFSVCEVPDHEQILTLGVNNVKR